MTHYRMLLYTEGMQQRNEEDRINRFAQNSKARNSKFEKGKHSPLSLLLRSRQRIMTCGGAIGGREFLTGLFEIHKTYFGQRQSASSYTIKGDGHA